MPQTSSSSSLEHLSEQELTSKLEQELLPKHVAVIMDGNGRWAELRSLPRIAGHREGINSVREMITLCLELGIHALTIYAFSQENWNRPTQEISALMGLLEYYLSTERASLIEQGVRFRTIGRLDALPESARHWVRTTEQETAHLNKLHLTVALSYGGRAEIVDAVRGILKDTQAGTVGPDQVDEALVSTLSLHPSASRPRPLDSHQRRNPNQQLSPLATGLHRALLHLNALARLPST